MFDRKNEIVRSVLDFADSCKVVWVRCGVISVHADRIIFDGEIFHLYYQNNTCSYVDIDSIKKVTFDENLSRIILE